MESTTLYYRAGSSDKVYRASIELRGSGYQVCFAYGRRGATLTYGTKNTEPVGFEEARKIYDKLIQSKTAKGYTPGPNGTLYQGSAPNTGDKRTGILPQLLNPVEAEALTALLTDRTHCLQPKHDGRRLLVSKQGSTITGTNRRGLACGMPETISHMAAALTGEFILDGEAVGDTFHAFDLLSLNGRDMRRERYSLRLAELLELLELVGNTYRNGAGILPVETCTEPACKREMFDRLRAQGAEGVVFKRLTAPYTIGRPNVGGDALKFKFVETASVLVTAINLRRSVALALLEEGTRVPVGNVTIPPNHPVPEPGAVVEVRYLYAMPDSRALYQPVYLGERDDIDPVECLIDQLKFRGDATAAAA